MTEFDITKIGEWTAEEYPRGGVIPRAGTSAEYRTGGWRSERPQWVRENCTQCLLCWVFCPDTSVRVKDEKFLEFDYDHCKGCGVCANECPSEAIVMVPEGCELREAK
jgi:pyruvate ferredoxin oxidoreductase delta subunit